QCGKLRESQLYNNEMTTGPDEHPWVGRLGNRKNDSFIEFNCLAVLIHERYALVPAHCILMRTKESGANVILFGDWRSNADIGASDCRAMGATQCSPVPQELEIEELAVHPLFNDNWRDYDIAVAKLARSVELTDYVQPICLPPTDNQPVDNYIGQWLETTGFRFYPPSNHHEEVNWRRKVLVHTATPEYCNSLTRGWILSHNQICAVWPSAEYRLVSGAPLMGIELVNGKPHRYYLIGISSFGSKNSYYFYIERFMRILPFKEWILRNIE
ncbi:hypothetical protein KR009_002319, partial [Drosophila setifemur]